MSTTTTITIRSRCHEYTGRWVPGDKRGPRTITVRSRCHEHDGQWTPEPEGVLATIARAEQRPGQCAIGMRPVEPAKEYTRALRRHWTFGRCMITRYDRAPEENVLGDHAFGRMVATDPKNVCRMCMKTWEDHHPKERAA